MKKIFTLLCLLPFASHVAQAQDIHFSQFWESSILRNPALMGTFDGDYKVTGVYRTQWSSISKPFRTGLFSAEARLPVKGESGDYFSIGMAGFFDRAGSIDLQMTGIYPSLSFTKYLGDGAHSFISAGFSGGYLQRSYDPSKGTYNNQYIGHSYDPANPTGEPSRNSNLTNWDLGAGIAYNARSADDKATYYVGFSGYHLTHPKRSFAEGGEFVKLETKWTVSGGFSYRLSDQYGIQANGDYVRQGEYNEIIVGGLIGWKRITENQQDDPLSIYAGVYYRWDDAAIPMVKLDFKRISVAMSYDFTTSKLRAANGGDGGMELTLTHTGLFNSAKYEKSRTICPKPW